MLLGSETGPIHNFLLGQGIFTINSPSLPRNAHYPAEAPGFLLGVILPLFRLCNIITVLTTCRMVDFLLVVVLDLIFKPETILYSLLLMQRLHDRIERGKSLPEIIT